MKTKEELRLLFENGDRPAQEDFWTWLDSYWHKDEKIDMTKIAGLENGFPRVNDFHTEIIEGGNASLAHLQVRRIFIKPGTLHIPDRFAVALGISELTLTSSLLTVGVDAFSSNALKTLTIPENVSIISERAFAFNQLSSVVIPDSVKEIKDSAFTSNRISALYIPPGVLKIGPNAFNYNPDLSSIRLDRNTQYYPDSFDAKTRVVGGTLVSDM
ncbi:MAG: leucine-rich repeat domain-containing protein [Chryseobacterium sp.]|nr:leucine-rich repeat domain-containing protein [Chryseobacterium sp.]MDN5421889.1 leucine-rich repeat domain-containing protein [Chryseobacterium sp.]MDN5476845.1 leucine-rich repeat domain-containing protein [Chryseobacterium sp.]MDN5480004.1 leucine-rich repeat domain-containing protein [Chryseobacterium sp.]